MPPQCASSVLNCSPFGLIWTSNPSVRKTPWEQRAVVVANAADL
jgi:hypothetical protein